MTNHNDSVVKESLTTATDGKQHRSQLYNLDVIIPVGYRVKSVRDTQFRIWASQRLKNIYESGKIEQPATTEQSSVVRQEGPSSSALSLRERAGVREERA